VHRVAQRFGLIATGGELAVAAGVLPWLAGESFAAAARCFTQWLVARGGIEPAEVREGIGQVRSFLLAHGMARFAAAWEINADQRLPLRDLVGFRKRAGEGWDFYVTPSAWREEVCAGLNAKAVAGTLAERGMLILPEKGPHRAKLETVSGYGKLRVYHIPARFLEEDGHD
jgi:putative DNA primase/helicase